MRASVPERSEAIIRHHVLLAAGAGLIPLPLVDLAAVTGIQVRMLMELASSAETIDCARCRENEVP